MPAKLPESTRRALRIQNKTWEKLAWLADEQGTTRPELIRRLLGAAVRHVKKPDDPNSRKIRPTETELAEWERVAKQRGLTADQFVRQVMGKICGRLDG